MAKSPFGVHQKCITSGNMSKDADSHSQPKPVNTEGSQSVTDAVIADLQFRREQGIAKYGMELRTNNGRDALVDAYQEAVDLAVYLKQALIEREERRKKATYCNCQL